MKTLNEGESKAERIKAAVRRTLEISLESNSNEGDGHDDETVVARVLELIQQGYTSGYEPTWCIKEDDGEDAL